MNAQQHPATDSWLAAERRRLAPELALAMVGRRITRAAPASPLAQALLDIANSIEASSEAGDFALCFGHTREDMASLPETLRAIAHKIGDGQ